MDEGYIKFEADWTKKPAFSSMQITQLLYWRRELYKLGLIGAYDENIGYGNISLRIGSAQEAFFISGSATGLLEKIDARHFSLVTAVDIPHNTVSCEGPVIASSESMSHAAIYAADPTINCVMHIHHKTLWQQYLDVLPTTPAEVAYGSPEMADSLAAIIRDPAARKKGILVTAGHEEGLFAFGESPEEAFAAIMEIFQAS